MTARPPSRWSPAAVVTLREMWRDNKSAQQIVHALGNGISVAAVFAKAARLGLQREDRDKYIDPWPKAPLYYRHLDGPLTIEDL